MMPLVARSNSPFVQTIRLLLSLSFFSLACMAQVSTSPPRIVEQDGRHALLVDGSPYLVLAAQIGNSNSWPAILPHIWPVLEKLHVNTVEAPAYWEQIEPEPGRFDWTNVDALLDGARAHHLRLIVLWFGTWKNGNDHYVPVWVKRDPVKYPRMLNSYGTPLDVLSANAPSNLDADRRAFTALTHHLAERDATEHTVLMIQVENESGAIGTVRDFSPKVNSEFASAVPPELVKALHPKPGNWAEVFPGNADEAFQAWTQARYINAIAEAGKRELPIPMYCNVWLAYPPSELPERRIPIPGIGYPSGGPVQTMLGLWKVAAPSIDAIGPDIYSSDPAFYVRILDTYNRPDNPLWIPETGRGNPFAPFFFSALGRGAIGFSPFGVGPADAHTAADESMTAHADNFALLSSMDRTIAKLNLAGHVKTAIEAGAGAEQEVVFTPRPDETADHAASIWCLGQRHRSTLRGRNARHSRPGRSRRLDRASPLWLSAARWPARARHYRSHRSHADRAIGAESIPARRVSRSCTVSSARLSTRHPHADPQSGRGILHSRRDFRCARNMALHSLVEWR